MRNLHRILTLVVVLALLVGCRGNALDSSQAAKTPELSSAAPQLPPRPAPPAPPSSAPEEPQPEEPPRVAYQPHGDYVWEVSGGQSTVYLIGTMHIVMPNYALTPHVSELLASCDALAVESDTDNQEMMDTLARMIVYTDGTSLYDHLSERGRAHIEWLCEQYGGIQPEAVSGYKPFFVSSLFELLPAQALGFLEEGVDSMLTNEAKAAGKPVLELEDGIAVYERFLSLPDDTMERVCILPIPGPEKMADELLEMYELYTAGDDDAMLAFLEDETDADMGGDGELIAFEEKDDLYEQYMLADRNRGMADSIISWLETPDRDVFTAAGLAHFLGEGNVIELLEAAGYTVARVEIEPGVPEVSDMPEQSQWGEAA